MSMVKIGEGEIQIHDGVQPVSFLMDCICILER